MIIMVPYIHVDIVLVQVRYGFALAPHEQISSVLIWFESVLVGLAVVEKTSKYVTAMLVSESAKIT